MLGARFGVGEFAPQQGTIFQIGHARQVDQSAKRRRAVHGRRPSSDQSPWVGKNRGPCRNGAGACVLGSATPLKEVPMPKIHPFLWFDTQAEDAANFYVSIFPNSKITLVNRY